MGIADSLERANPLGRAGVCTAGMTSDSWTSQARSESADCTDFHIEWPLKSVLSVQSVVVFVLAEVELIS